MSVIQYLIEGLSPSPRYLYVGDGAEYDDVDVDALINGGYALTKKSTINILSDKELNTVAVIGDSVVGGLWTSFVDNIYSFDVIVDPEFEGLGIGSKLTDIGISDFDMYEDHGAKMELHVVNPKMESILKKKGFYVVKDILGATIMRRKR